MTEAMVYEGSKSEALISGRLPMTIVTAIVSPTARPKPSMIAPAMPGAPLASTIRVVSHFVAPKASAASRCETGTAASTSRTTAVIIGVTMMASMQPAEGALQWRLDVFTQGRREHEDAPQPVDDRRNRREQFDDEAERARERGRGLLD